MNTEQLCDQFHHKHPNKPGRSEIYHSPEILDCLFYFPDVTIVVEGPHVNLQVSGLPFRWARGGGTPLTSHTSHHVQGAYHCCFYSAHHCRHCCQNVNALDWIGLLPLWEPPLQRLQRCHRCTADRWTWKWLTMGLVFSKTIQG